MLSTFCVPVVECATENCFDTELPVYIFMRRTCSRFISDVASGPVT